MTILPGWNSAPGGVRPPCEMERLVEAGRSYGRVKRIVRIASTAGAEIGSKSPR